MTQATKHRPFALHVCPSCGWRAFRYVDEPGPHVCPSWECGTVMERQRKQLPRSRRLDDREPY